MGLWLFEFAEWAASASPYLALAGICFALAGRIKSLNPISFYGLSVVTVTLVLTLLLNCFVTTYMVWGSTWAILSVLAFGAPTVLAGIAAILLYGSWSEFLGIAFIGAASVIAFVATVLSRHRLDMTRNQSPISRGPRECVPLPDASETWEPANRGDRDDYGPGYLEIEMAAKEHILRLGGSPDPSYSYSIQLAAVALNQEAAALRPSMRSKISDFLELLQGRDAGQSFSWIFPDNDFPELSDDPIEAGWQILDQVISRMSAEMDGFPPPGERALI